MPLMQRQFKQGDAVTLKGTNLKGVIVKLEKIVTRIKVEMLDGEEEGYEEWYDVDEFELFKKKK